MSVYWSVELCTVGKKVSISFFRLACFETCQPTMAIEASVSPNTFVDDDILYFVRRRTA